jgi:tetratricopeptide (TPR) repeat protein
MYDLTLKTDLFSNRRKYLNTTHKYLVMTLIPLGLTFILSLSTASAESRRQVLTGTRPLGMAGAFLTVSDDSHTVSWNPAGMPFVRHQELAVTRNDVYRLGLIENSLIYLLPVTDRHAVGFDWFNTGFDDDELDFTENRFTLAYSYNFRSTLSLGASLKYFNQSQGLDGINFSQADGLGVDLGVIFSPIPKLRLGAVALDATDTWIKFSKSGARDRLYRRNIRIGASYQPLDALVIAADYDNGFHLGAEYWFKNSIGVRGGVYEDFASADGLRYALGGSLKYSFGQNPSIRLDYAFQNHPVLPETHRLTAGVAFELTPSLVKIEKIEAQPVFSSLYPRYADIPLGRVTLRNKRKKPLKVSVSVFIPKYMEGPTEIAQDLVLVGATGDALVYSEPLALKPAFGTQILGVEQNISTQMHVTVTYEYLGRTRQTQKSESVFIYRPGMLPLGDSVAPIAALIDPFDPTIQVFTNEVVSQYSTREEMNTVNRNVSTAMQIYNALNGSEVKYNPDPYNPYGTVPIDHVTYPSRMIHQKVGDCDDETALYAAALESVGIHTRLVGVPEHVYVMFNTGIHKRKAARLSLPEDTYILLEDSSYVWIPVEVTRFGNAAGSTFWDAWAEGAREYNQWLKEGQVEVVDVHHAWREGYPYNRLPGDTPEVLPPSRTVLTPLIVGDIATLRDRRNTYLAELREQTRTQPDNLRVANRLATTYAMLNRYGEAEATVNSILQRDPRNAPALNTLGNIQMMRGNPDAAKDAYRRAREADADDPGIQLNEGFSYKISGDDTQGDALLTAAIQQAGSSAAALDLLGIPPTPEPGRETAQLVESQIRLLITKLAGEGGETVPLPRASEAGAAGEFYLYWKE